MIRPIRVYPDPVLRVRCPEAAAFDEELTRLVADMVETMHAAPGVGLAAPQVGVERRVAVVDLSVGRDPASVLVLVNPVIEAAEGSEIDTEGCLSIPDFTEKVPRPTRIAVSAADLTGERRSFVAEGFLARAICHEVDHLDGVLFVDHLRGLRKERAKRFLKRVAREQEQGQDPEGRGDREDRQWDEASASR
jgi:peptide deformylase